MATAMPGEQDGRRADEHLQQPELRGERREEEVDVGVDRAGAREQDERRGQHAA